MENKKTSFHKFMDATRFNKRWCSGNDCDISSTTTQGVNVELALVDDLDKVYQSAISVQEKAEMMIVDYNEMASKIVALLNQAGSDYLRANSIFQEVEQMSKELGVDLSAPLKNRKQIIAESIKELDAYKKKLASNKVPV
jgi:hypothetical protein